MSSDEDSDSSPSPSAQPPRTIVVTGAGRGIGRAVALDLAASTDAALVLISRTDNCVATADACRLAHAATLHGAEVSALPWDLTRWNDRATEFEDLVRAASGPVALVHAAGVLGVTGPFTECDLDRWWHGFEANVRPAVSLVRALLPRMLSDGAGRIVLFAGGGAAYGYPNFSSYGTAKAALVRFTETVAMEIAGRGPSITIIAPGANDTDMLAEVRRAGGTVKTTVSMDEPCTLVRRLLTEQSSALSGRFVHVRDLWTPSSAAALSEDHFKLRRVE